jgi:hypothetical protein
MRRVTPAMVTHWARTGRLAILDGKVDVVASDALLMASLDSRRGGPSGGPLNWADAIRADSLTDSQVERLARVAISAAVLALVREIAGIAGTPAERP